MSAIVFTRDIDVNYLRRCLEHYGVENSRTVASCRLQLVLSAQRLRENLGLNREEIELLWSLGAEIQRDLNGKDMKGKSIRQECRSMREWERKNLFDAINYIKKNTSNPAVVTSVIVLLAVVLVRGVSSVIDTYRLSRCLLNYGISYRQSLSCKWQFKLSEQRLKDTVGLEREEIELLWDLGAEILREKRDKRQPYGYSPGGGYGDNMGIRQECRAMSDWKRRQLFDAINYLKKNTSNPNVYLTMAKLHRGNQVFRHAHGGSNFLGWHRLYLLLYHRFFSFERALQRVNRNVALCYWDSSIDFRLGKDDWVYTTAFSDPVFGSGEGEVKDGPFTDWYLPPPNRDLLLRRDIRIGKAIPIDARAVDLILRSPKLLSHTSITVGGSGFQTITDHNGDRRDVTIEGEHNNVHVFVGALMSNSDMAPLDPVFFFHHCYIDYLWEGFRKKMKRKGFDPTSDYPGHGQRESNAANYSMIGFNWYKNIDGYSDVFTSDLYTYEVTPSCKGYSPSCRYSNFMKCNKANECVATTRPLPLIELAHLNL
ncbi:hypothetical protein FSP39_004089 [Pinctada imbricata]|uniref:Tyrosinase copper-binding domain-containing protein n=1 Tax=Pinctada imbricata TaxID=66713 RepID=A0AA88YDI9_PINIB|nr:hypothetical protein FSP39_004089 [Pinctada imbricata]